MAAVEVDDVVDVDDVPGGIIGGAVVDEVVGIAVVGVAAGVDD